MRVFLLSVLQVQTGTGHSAASTAQRRDRHSQGSSRRGASLDPRSPRVDAGSRAGIANQGVQVQAQQRGRVIARTVWNGMRGLARALSPVGFMARAAAPTAASMLYIAAHRFV
jgi:hypothetical protein